ncbi:MAG: hypothetical protein M1834_002861 [Cirrosporium novae-zelandiae]|nr:MAG: hypothetical protein M1834_002861 [Cirrosporium novae-zelandiae]
MPLTILTDSDVRSLLLSLNRDDVLVLQHNLGEALHEYSTGTSEAGCCSTNQPFRTSIKRIDGQTTLFMPASASGTTGMKIVTLSEGSTPSPSASKSSSPSLSSTHSLNSNSSYAASYAPSSLGEPPLEDDSFNPPESMASSQSTTPHGSLTLLDSTGSPLGFINAEELTAFRTALAATIMFSRRSHVNTITVFGAGKQAYWHIRLALLLRGDEIKHVNIINRTFSRAHRLLQELYSNGNEYWHAQTKFTVLSAEFGEYSRLLKEEVRKADVIFCCTPSTEPLFPAEYLTSIEGRRKGRLVSLIGSYKPHMLEIHPDILKQAVEPDHGRHHHKHAKQSGVIVVDSLDSCLKEAGEVIQAELQPEHLVEVGELMMIKKAIKKEVELGGEGDDGLKEWLEKGNVIYKSVGFGLMDVVVGGDVVMLARERGMGTTIDNF